MLRSETFEALLIDLHVGHQTALTHWREISLFSYLPLRNRLKLAQLDIVDDVSIEKLAETIKRDHGGIDILINNAGFAFKNAATESMSEQAEKTIAINYFGTKVGQTCTHALRAQSC